MSDSTSKDEFDFNDDDFVFEKDEVDSPNNVENEESIVTAIEQKESDKVIARLCRKCRQKFSPTTTTRILNNYLSKKHGIKLTLKKNSLIQRPYSRGDTQCKKECFDTILNFVVCCQLPFTIIKNPCYHRCSTHVLNLTVNYRMQLKVSVISKVRDCVNKIKYSTVLCNALRQFCEMNQKSYTKPIVDEVIDNMIELLEPILVTTELLSSSAYPIISDIFLTFLELLLHLNKFLDNELYSDQYMMADSIKSKLNKYWSMLEESTTIATILDSSSKLVTFPTSDKKDAALTSLQNIMTQYKSQVSVTTTFTSISELVSKNKRKFFELLLIQQQTIEQPLIEKLEHYLSMPMTIKNNSLLWWDTRSSVSCKEAFSTAAETITKVHNRLDPQTACVSLFLKSWIEQGA
ncbi:14231_t:CDS:2, partial [Dentiscutata erythropus]